MIFGYGSSFCRRRRFVVVLVVLVFKKHPLKKIKEVSFKERSQFRKP